MVSRYSTSGTRRAYNYRPSTLESDGGSTVVVDHLKLLYENANGQGETRHILFRTCLQEIVIGIVKRQAAASITKRTVGNKCLFLVRIYGENLEL